MNEKAIFEIPIYSMTNDEYKKRCFKYIDKIASTTTNDNYNFFHQHLELQYYKKRPWKYNQIIGYIVVSYKDSSIWFDEYCTLDKKIHAIGDNKHIIDNLDLNGYHFYINGNMKNDAIKKAILKWIEIIERDSIKKPLFLDKSVFLLQLEYIDIEKIIRGD